MIEHPSAVLLIDDDLDDWEIFSLALKELCPAIKCVCRGYCNIAIDDILAKTIEPDYIFLDLNMPRMPGRECLKYLKNIEHIWHIPIIIYSTSTRAEDKKELLEAGASFYVCKTSTLGELIRQLRLVIANYPGP